MARGILLVKRTDAFQVAFGLEGHGLVLVQLGPGLIGACLIELGVDDEQGLPFADIGTLFEHHLFEEALDPGSDLDELLGADASDVFAVEFDIVGLDGLDFDHGPDGFCGFGTQPPPQPSGRHYGDCGDGDPGAFGKTADLAAGLFAQFQRAAS